MKRQKVYFILAFLVLAISGLMAAEDNWPRWRGPNQNGITDAVNHPMKWSQTENIR